MRNNPEFHRRGGVAMLLVIIAVAIAAILSVSFLSGQATTTAVAANVRKQVSARGIAEAGVQLGLAAIQRDPDWRTNYSNGTWVTNQSLSGGTFTLQGIDADGSLSDDPADDVTLIATATYDGVTHSTSLVVKTTVGNVKAMLLVVPTVSPLGASDQARKTFAEGLGWQVSLLGQTATQAELDDALEDVDLVYVSAGTTNTTMGGRLKLIEQGLVSESSSLADNLGLCSSEPVNYSHTQVTISDEAHYLTQTLGAGTITVLSSSQNLMTTAGTTAAGATMLAKRPTKATSSLSIIEAGGALQGGGSAEGRRVFLPWGVNNFDFTKLNATGRSLLERSFDWVAGADSTGSVSANRIAVATSVKLSGSGRIDSFRASSGAYSTSNSGSEALVSTNSILPLMVTLTGGSQIKGDLFVGKGGLISVVLASLLNGNAITGTKGVLAANIAFPTVKAPTNLGSSSGDKTYSSGTTTLSSNLHCKKLTVTGSAILKISGNVTILADNNVTIDNNAQIQLQPGSTLTIYGKKLIQIGNSAKINVNTARPNQVVIYGLGAKAVTIEGSAQVYASVIGLKCKLSITGSAQLCGTFLGKSLDIEGSGKLSMDASSEEVFDGSSGSSFSYSATYADQP